MVESEAARVTTGEVGFCSQCGTATPVVVGPNDRLQRRVRRAVEKRGYFRGWSARQLVLRQVTKLAEEMTELASPVRGWLPTALWTLLEAVGATARWHFDRGYWQDARLTPEMARDMLAELADVQVVVFCLADILGEVLGEEVDVARLAVEKAERDVNRGVR